MSFEPGDAVHVRAIGKGVVRDVRNNGRFLVDVAGRSIVTTADQLTAIDASRVKPRPAAVKRHVHEYAPSSHLSMSIDLHGLTVDEAMEAMTAFLNDALLRGAAEVRIIHGRSGGRIKSSVHAQLKRMPSVRSYSIDPENAGVTIARF
jgi:DNA mismatch repair protein MutS2